MSSFQDIQLTTKQKLLTILLILLIVASLGLRLYFSSRSLDISGPDYIAANDQVAIISANKTFHVTNQYGEILFSHPHASAGIKNGIADIQILDNARFIVADRRDRRFLECDIINMDCNFVGRRLPDILGRQFKFHYRKTQHDIFIADTRRHRILHYKLADDVITEISSIDQLKYPNDLEFERDGYLYVTDTNHHRIARFEFDGQSLQPASNNSIKVKQRLTTNRYPVNFARTWNGDMYILQADGDLANATLVHLPDSGQQSIITLPENADIVNIEKMANRLLLADSQSFSVYTFDTRNHQLELFGQDSLQKMLTKTRQERDHYDFISTAALALITVLVVLIAVYVAYLARHGKRKNRTAGTTPAVQLEPLVPGKLVWLEKNPVLDRIFILVLILMAILGACTISIFYLFREFAGQLQSRDMTIIFAALLIFIAILVFTVVNVYHNIRYSIGTDGNYLYLKRYGNLVRIRLSDILYSNHYLSSRHHHFMYRTNAGLYVHDKQQFEHYIQPLLNSFATKAGLMEITRNMLRYRNRMFYINLLGLLIIVLATVYLFSIRPDILA